MPAHKETDLGYADIKGPGGKFAGLLQLLKARLQAFGKQRLALFQAWISLVENECVGTIGLVKQEIAEQYHARKRNAGWPDTQPRDFWGVWLPGALPVLKKLQIYPPVRRDMTIGCQPWD